MALCAETNATYPKYTVASEHAKLIGTIDGMFPDFGHHSEREMGGLWMHPIKVLDGYWLRLHDTQADNVNTWILADHCRIEPGKTTFRYTVGLGHTSIRIARTELAPESVPGLVVSYTFSNQGAEERRIEAELLVRTDLQPVWFSAEAGQFADAPDDGEWDAPTFRARDRVNPWFAAVRCGTQPDCVRIGEELFGPQCTAGSGISAAFGYDLTIPGGERVTLTFFMTGSALSAAEAEERARLLASGRDFEAEKQAHYDDLAARSSLHVGDERFERIWEWVKVGTDWLTVNAPPYGRGIAAGMPEYMWWFGCDSCYTVQGLLAIGEYDLAQQTLRLLADYSEKVNGNGRIPHEITTYGLCANPGNTQETAHYVTAVWHYWRWTGDRTLPEALMPLLRKSMAWLTEMDDDGDLFPSGYGIIEIAGLNAEMIDTIVYTAQAWGCYADLCELIGDSGEALRARDTHERALEAIERIMWDDEAGLYCDACAGPAFVRSCKQTVLGRRGTYTQAQADAYDAMADAAERRGLPEAGFLINHNWVINTPMESGIAPRAHAERALANMNGPDCIGEWGMYLDTVHRSMIMTISTGTMAVAQARYGYADRALALLEKMNAAFGRLSPCTIAEVLPDEGCFTQAWTAYALFTPVVRHLFGIQPEAKEGVVHVTPSLPQKWQDASIERVRVLDGSLSVHCVCVPEGLRVTLTGEHCPDVVLHRSLADAEGQRISLSDHEPVTVLLHKEKGGIIP